LLKIADAERERYEREIRRFSKVAEFEAMLRKRDSTPRK
jgi:hypothetical protein